ncbi:MAG: methyltransferase domain-containing protein [Pseudomonadota bacterium]
MRPDEVIDDFMEGRLKIIQSRRGYRFSIDAILLSQFVSIKPKDIVVDLGTGCGVIPLILLLRRPLGHVFGLEIQPAMAGQAARNALLNGFSEKMEIILGDMRHAPLKPSSADLVVCNPPYRKMNTGRINPDPQKAIARHEIMASLNDILTAAKRILKINGRLAMIYPAVRLTDILGMLRDHALEPKRMQVIYPGLESEAKLVMLEACFGGKSGLKIHPPLIDQGDFSIGT